MTLEGMKLTNHAIYDRASRIDYINRTIGFGETVRAIKCEDGRTGMKCLTETGVIVIRDELDMRVMITCYIATLAQARAMYPEGILPRWLFEVVQRNVREGYVDINYFLT